MSRSHEEKRATRRIPVQCPVQFKRDGKSATYEGLLKNLSVGGIAFESQVFIAPGELVDILLLPPQASSVLPLDAVIQVTRSVRHAATVCEIAGRIKTIRS